MAIISIGIVTCHFQLQTLASEPSPSDSIDMNELSQVFSTLKTRRHYQLQAFACEPSPSGRMAMKEMSEVLLTLEENPHLKQCEFYKSRHDRCYCYFKKMGPAVYIIMSDQETSEETLNEYCADLSHIALSKEYNELNNIMADPTYAVSPIRKLKLELKQLHEEACRDIDIFIKRYGKLEDLLKRTEKLTNETKDFKLGLTLSKQEPEKSIISRLFCSFFCIPTDIKKDHPPLPSYRFGIN